MAATKRFTIGLGFLSDYVYENYSSSIFKSVQQACAEEGLNFIGFEGGFSRVLFGLYNQRKNAVIDLIDRCNLDGMILLAEHAANTMTEAELKRLYRNLEGVPIVSIGRSRKAAASVLIDNKRSMRELVAHLLNDHGYRRIAFLSGPDTSCDGRERFDAYVETLQEFGVPIDDRLIVRGGDFYSSGERAVETLCDERRVRFDALVAANDSMAMFAIKELERRGMRVPGDVAVAGFDDIEAGRRLATGLTTIRQSFYDIGRESVRVMHALLSGEKVPRRIVLPTKLIIRESCGCTDAEKISRLFSTGRMPRMKKASLPRLGAPEFPVQLAGILAAEMPSLLEKPGVRKDVEELARALPASFDAAGRKRFIERLGAFFGRLFTMKQDLYEVLRLAVRFFPAARNACGDPKWEEALRSAYEEALILAGLSSQAHQADEVTRKKANEKSELIVNDDFLNLLHLGRLKEIIYMQLPKMQFRRFYVCLYTDPSRREAKLLMQYHSGDDLRPVPDHSPFPANHLLPGMIRRRGGFALMVVALFFEDTDFGYMLFDITDLVIEPIYDDLATQISGAINSAMQAKAIHEYAGQLEEKVKARTRQLEAAVRERADFFNDIAHEIKNPLTLISNYLDAYIAKQGTSEELRVMKTNFDALLQVMVDYLSREKIERGKIVFQHKQTADFSGIVRNDVILFRETARRKNIHLKDAVEPAVYVRADPEALERVVENILQNAVRFTNPGGVITVTLRKKGDKVEFSVKDTGIGLTPEQVKHIFERYYQANAAGEGTVGTGLGLDIVKRILDEVGAGIRVTSTEGKGTNITCTFEPARPPARLGAPAAERIQPAEEMRADEYGSVTERGNLLFVEDNAELLHFLVESTKAEFNVYQATNGCNALEMLKHIPKPNIIVSDVLMDEMDGFRFFEELMKDDYYRDIPFIFLTGVNTRPDRFEALKKGAVDYITKPFRIDELIAKIKSNLRIQDALKKKNIILLGNRLYRTIEDLMRNKKADLADGGFDDLNRLYFKHGISRKEIEVISLLRLGLLHKEIAARLNISINTVRTYIARVYKKCNVNSPLELFAKLKSL